MIEVTLAIAIVALGLTGILSLFPVGFQSIRDAVGDNYVNDSSQLFLSYIKLLAKEDTSTPPATQTQTQIDDQWNLVIVPIPTSKPDANGINETTNPSLAGYILTEIPSIYYHDPPHATPPIPSIPAIPGLYRIYSGTNDFKAAVRVWRNRIVSPVLNSAGTAWVYNSPFDTEACGLNIEFSWPIEKPYAQRTKRFFYYEIFKTIL